MRRLALLLLLCAPAVAQTTLEKCQAGACYGYGPPTGNTQNGIMYQDYSQTPPALYCNNKGTWGPCGSSVVSIPSITTGDTTRTAGALAETVVGIQGVPVVSTPPTTGQALVYNGTNYAPGTVSGGSGTPSGSSGNLQYNNSGTFGGDANTSDDGAGNISVASLNATGGCPGATSGGCVGMVQIAGTPSGVTGGGLFYFTATAPVVNINNSGAVNLITSGGDINASNQVTATHLTAALPVAQGGTALASGTSGGILGYTAAGTLASSVALTANALVKGGGPGATPTPSSVTDNGSSVVTTEPVTANSFVTAGTTAFFVDYPQGSTSAAVTLCNTPTSICEQAPTAVVSYLVNKPGTAANGLVTNSNVSNVITQGFSGDANHAATIVIGSGSIASTSLCSTSICPAGTYHLDAYLDLTTACTTGGTYSVSLVWTDDQGSKTQILQMTGAGETSGSLALTPVTNYGQISFVLRSSGAASINYLTTAGACSTGGPAVGNLYLRIYPI